VAVRITYLVKEAVLRPRVAVDIHRGDGVYCFGTTTYEDGSDETVTGEQVVELRLPRLALLPGAYVVSVGVHRPNGGAPYDLHLSTYPLSVESDCRDRGVVAMEAQWTHGTP
jgi:ABC-2 type transport system ATP-binding protein